MCFIVPNKLIGWGLSVEGPNWWFGLRLKDYKVGYPFVEFELFDGFVEYHVVVSGASFDVILKRLELEWKRRKY